MFGITVLALGIILLGLIGLIAVVWVIYDVLTIQKEMPDIEKLIWVLVALFLGLIGALVYYFIVKRSKKYEAEAPAQRR
jgi:pilus assembly protein TadC